MRWIVGDIHGMLIPLRELLREIARRDPWAHLLFVGDYVNRGPDSKGVLDLLLTLRNAHFVRGNHDDIFDMVLHGECYVPELAVNPVAAFDWFMQFGLSQTFQSYGISPPTLNDAHRFLSADTIKKLGESVPVTHRNFIRRLPATIEHEDLFVAHGMWGADEPDGSPSIAALLASSAQLRKRTLWGRFEMEIPLKKKWRRTGYFGHTPVQNYSAELRHNDILPIRGPNLVLLDTGAATSDDGRLTAVCAETGESVQADRAGKLVQPGQVKP